MTTPAAKPPPREMGRPGNVIPNFTWPTRNNQNQYQADPADPTPDLQFPRSVKIYEQMRTDAQVDTMMRALTLPILDATWDLNTEGIAPEVVEFIRAEIGVPEAGKALPRRRRGQAGIVWREHLREALGALAFGFMPFEQVYFATLPGDPGHPDGRSLPAWHLQKLAQRLPSTVSRILVGRDGGLQGLLQKPSLLERGTQQWTDPEPIPVNQLVMYCIDREGGDWYGRSMLRTAYKHWLIKDQLIRIDAQTAERNGMGIPVHTRSDQGMTKDEGLEMVSEVRSGSTAGVSLGVGDDLKLIGVSGSLHDTIASIKYHDQQISKAGLAMFLDLGHDQGARSLGDTFVDILNRAQQSLSGVLASVATEHIIRDLVELNFGADEPYPALTATDISTESALSPEAMQMLVDAKVLTADETLESSTRARFRLPARKGPRPSLEPAAPTPAPTPAPLQAVPDLAASASTERIDGESLEDYAVRLSDRVKRLRANVPG